MACARRMPTWSMPTFSPSSRAKSARCESKEKSKMKIVVIGGTGLIGSKTVSLLRQGGHEVAAASPNTGIHSNTAQGPQEATGGPPGGIDLPHTPPLEDKGGAGV